MKSFIDRHCRNAGEIARYIRLLQIFLWVEIGGMRFKDIARYLRLSRSRVYQLYRQAKRFGFESIMHCGPLRKYLMRDPFWAMAEATSKLDGLYKMADYPSVWRNLITKSLDKDGK